MRIALNRIIQRHEYVLLMVGIVFVVIYSWFYWGNQFVFSSPDENANFAFIQNFHDNSTFKIFAPGNEIAAGMFHPRSATVVGTDIVPATFTGIIFYLGLISKIIGTRAILFIAPLLVVGVVQVLYKALQYFFDRNVSFISSLLVFFLIPFWYYSSRSMFHNIYYVLFLILSWSLLMLASQKEHVQKKLFFVLSGLSAGTAIFIRTSEFPWFAALMAATFILVYPSKYYLKYAGWFLGAAGVALLPMLFMNAMTYGSPFTFAYTLSSDIIPAVASSQNAAAGWVRVLAAALFPFGFSLGESWSPIKQYFILFMPLYSIFLFLGLISIALMGVRRMLLRWGASILQNSNISKRQLTYVGVYIFFSLWLFIYYGSYSFSEFIDSSQTIIGSSYLRYWIPIFIFGLPIWIMGVQSAADLFFERSRRNIISFVCLIFLITSVVRIFGDPVHGLQQVKTFNQLYAQRRLAITNSVAADAIMLVYNDLDKYIFPYRQVIVKPNLLDETQSESLRKLAAQYPVYLAINNFDITPKIFDPYSKSGFQLVLIDSLSDDVFRFYQVSAH